MSIWKRMSGSNELTTVKVERRPSRPSSTQDMQQSSNSSSPAKAADRLHPAANKASTLGDFERTFDVPAEAQGHRLYQFLASQLGGMSRSGVNTLMEQRQVLVDGRQRADSYKLSGGEKIVIAAALRNDRAKTNGSETPRGVSAAPSGAPSQPPPPGVTPTQVSQSPRPTQGKSTPDIGRGTASTTVKPKGSDGKTVQTKAVEPGKAPEAKVPGDARINAKDDLGKTALMRAAKNDDDAAEIHSLIAAGADVDARDSVCGQTALFFACNREHGECVKALLAAGADVNAKDKFGGTPLMEAALHCEVGLVKALIAAGADVRARNNDGDNVLKCAAHSNDSAPNLKALIGAGAEVNAKGKHEQTALMMAAANFSPDCVKTLIAAGANVNAKDEWGKTALFLATGGNVMNCSEGRDLECIRALIAAGADVNANTVDGFTALMRAAFMGRPNNVKFLIQAGADPRARNNKGETALMRAEEGGRNPECIRVLTEAESHGGSPGITNVRVRCTECGVVYTVGVDTICVTDSDIMSWLTGGGATVIGKLSSETPMLGKVSPDHAKIPGSKETILRLAPKHGWQCECRQKNRWNPIRN